METRTDNYKEAIKSFIKQGKVEEAMEAVDALATHALHIGMQCTENCNQNKSDSNDMVLRQKEGAKVFTKEINKLSREISKKASVCHNSIATPDPDDDQVNNPSHYQSYIKDGMDCITAMQHAFGIEATAIFCKLNAFKYIWRESSKGGKESVEKAIWYLNKYLELNK